MDECRKAFEDFNQKTPWGGPKEVHWQIWQAAWNARTEAKVSGEQLTEWALEALDEFRSELPAPQSPVVPVDFGDRQLLEDIINLSQLVLSYPVIRLPEDICDRVRARPTNDERASIPPVPSQPVSTGVDLSKIQRWEEYDFGLTRHSWGPWVKFDDVRHLLANARESREGVLREALMDAREVLDIGGARHVLGTDKAMALIAKIDEALATFGKEG